ncbi:unnamed protein product [Arctogadus glacialis]
MSRPLDLSTAGCNFSTGVSNWSSTALPPPHSPFTRESTFSPESTTLLPPHGTVTPGSPESSVFRPVLADSWYSVSYMYFSPIGTLTALTVGVVVSLLSGGWKNLKLTCNLRGGCYRSAGPWPRLTRAKSQTKGSGDQPKAPRRPRRPRQRGERLEKEEEERRLQEKEMARLQEEQEKQERLERERREQEEMERLEAKDQERREDELNEVRHLLEENQVAVKRWLADTREKAKWDRFMLCDGRPDPSQTQEVNTYISLWRDDPEVDAVPALQQCSLALQLIEGPWR